MAANRDGRPRGRPARADSERTHERILSAARAVFADTGYSAAQNARIAERADVASSTLYHYFPSKLDLFVAVFRDAERRVASRYEAASADSRSTRDRLLAILDAAERLYAEDATTTLFLARVPTEMHNDEALSAAIVRGPVTLRAFFRALVADGAARGELQPGVRAEDLADLYAATTVGIALFGRPGDVAGYARLVDALRTLTRASVFCGPARTTQGSTEIT